MLVASWRHIWFQLIDTFSALEVIAVLYHSTFYLITCVITYFYLQLLVDMTVAADVWNNRAIICRWLQIGKHIGTQYSTLIGCPVQTSSSPPVATSTLHCGMSLTSAASQHFMVTRAALRPCASCRPVAVSVTSDSDKRVNTSRHMNTQYTYEMCRGVHIGLSEFGSIRRWHTCPIWYGDVQRKTSFYLTFYIICFYHLLYAVAYKLTIISFPQHPTWMALYSLIVLMCR